MNILFIAVPALAIVTLYGVPALSRALRHLWWEIHNPEEAFRRATNRTFLVNPKGEISIQYT